MGSPEIQRAGKARIGNLTILRTLEITPKFKKKLVITLTSVIVLTAILQIWTVNRLSTFGEQITKLEQTKQALLLENQLLENQIASKSSLTENSELSKKLGYQKIAHVEYFEDHDLALNR